MTVVVPAGAPPVGRVSHPRGARIVLLPVVSAAMMNATAGIDFLILVAGDLMRTSRLVVEPVLLALLGLESTGGLIALERRLGPGRERRT